MSSLPVGTTVQLTGLSSKEYNGKKGRVAVTAEEMAARGRIAVIVDGATLWCTEENGGYREENEDDFEDNTSAKEPKGKGTVELASAKHCEGDKGNMILQAQRL